MKNTRIDSKFKGPKVVACYVQKLRNSKGIFSSLFKSSDRRFLKLDICKETLEYGDSEKSRKLTRILIDDIKDVAILYGQSSKNQNKNMLRVNTSERPYTFIFENKPDFNSFLSVLRSIHRVSPNQPLLIEQKKVERSQSTPLNRPRINNSFSPFNEASSNTMISQFSINAIDKQKIPSLAQRSSMSLEKLRNFEFKQKLRQRRIEENIKILNNKNLPQNNNLVKERSSAPSGIIYRDKLKGYIFGVTNPKRRSSFKLNFDDSMIKKISNDLSSPFKYSKMGIQKKEKEKSAGSLTDRAQIKDNNFMTSQINKMKRRHTKHKHRPNTALRTGDSRVCQKEFASRPTPILDKKASIYKSIKTRMKRKRRSNKTIRGSFKIIIPREGDDNDNKKEQRPLVNVSPVKIQSASSKKRNLINAKVNAESLLNLKKAKFSFKFYLQRNKEASNSINHKLRAGVKNRGIHSRQKSTESLRLPNNSNHGNHLSIKNQSIGPQQKLNIQSYQRIIKPRPDLSFLDDISD